MTRTPTSSFARRVSRPGLVVATLLAAPVLLAACGDDPAGSGNVAVTVYGEDFIELGIPASEVADGWSVTFDAFNVTVSDIDVAGATIAGPVALEISEPTEGAGYLAGVVAADAGSHTGHAFTIDRVELSGSATRDDVTKTFDWVFVDPVRYSACETTTVVNDGGEASFQITIHADHYFYDSIVSSEPSLVFDELAGADVDEDGVITQAELEAADPGALDTGSSGDIDTLWAYLVALNQTLGHVDGEGHCDSAPAMN